ncbi:MAG: FAD-binding protein [Sneathiella sp.]|nr:FAD-binding protein [Sneathiella sp.]
MEKFKISTSEQLQDVLQWALAGGKKLSINGGGSKSTVGRPFDADAEIRMTDFHGTEMHEPAELVMQAKAGSRLTDIVKILDESGQKLAFSPPDYGPLLGKDAGISTIGGVFACNLSGSARIKAGGARDHLLGVKGFTGRGQAFQTGSRVMKNVTGYDLCKLITGSYGTLAVCTSLTFKVLPKADKTRTVLIYGQEPGEAVESLRDAMSSIHEVTAAAYLPKNIAERSDIKFVSDAGEAVTAISIEGSGPSTEFRCDALRKMFEICGAIEEQHGQRSEQLWAYIGGVGAFVEDQTTNVWRVSIPPSEAPEFISKLEALLSGAEYYLDWAGGLIWVSVPASAELAGSTILRDNLVAGGHATLIRGTETVRSTILPFQPQNSVLTRISESIREGFDPTRILNPGRMYPISDGMK